MTYAIQVHNLIKSYGDVRVLKGINFHVEKGEIFGILGINGAGKTTMLECMEGFRKYEGGEILYDGKIGVQLQSASLPAFMKPLEAVQLFSKWQHGDVDMEVLSILGIPALKKKVYMNLSTGQKRRLHLALALIGNPDILFLDEPAAGLDVEGKHALHHEIRKCKAQGKTIVLASHDMSEVESLCDRIAILHQGQMAFIGTTSELASNIKSCFHIKIVTKQGEETFTTHHLIETILQVLQNYQKQNIEILDMKIDRGTLEQHFMNIAKGESVCKQSSME